MRTIAYLFIWGDLYVLFFAAHALYLGGSIDLESHLEIYLPVFLPLVETFLRLGPWAEAYVDFFYAWPAALVWTLRFWWSTLIGVWLLGRAERA